jgi:O-antigen/teichoic acid export membrane protein
MAPKRSAEQADPLPAQPSPPEPAGRADAGSDASRGSAVKLGAESLGRLLSLGTALLVARALGPEDFGRFAVYSGVAVLCAELGDLGLQGTASRALVTGTLRLSDLLRAKLALTGVVLGLAALAVPALARWPGVSWLLVPFVLYYLASSWSEFFGVALRARGRGVGEAATIVCFRATALSLVAIVVAAGGGLRAVAWALSLSPLPAAALGALLVRDTQARAALGPIEAASVRAVVSLSLPLGLNAGLSLVRLRLETLLLAWLRGERETGLFAAGLRIVESLILVPASISAGAMPALTLESLGGSGAARERTARTLALLGVPAAVGLGLLAPGLVGLLYGPRFAAAAGPLRLLAPALACLFLSSLLLQALIATGHAALLPRLTGARLAAAALLAALLLPRFGAAGAAAGFTLAEAVLVPLAAHSCARAGAPVALARALLSALVLSAPMAVAVMLVPLGVLARVALGALSYGVTLLLAWRVAPGLLRPAALAR